MATMKPLTRQSSVNNKWSGACKICRLFLSDPDIWIEFHEKWHSGSKMSDLQRWLNARLDIINSHRDPEEQLAEFNRENLNRHLKGLAQDGTTGHCTDFLACKDQIENGNHSKEFQEKSKAIVLNPEIFEASERILAKVSENMTEFLSLSQMVASLESVLAYYDGTLKQRMEASERITIEELENYQKQVTGLVKLKQDMSKLRNTAKIAGDAVNSTLELATLAFIEKLIPILNEGKEMFKSEYPGSSLPDEVFNMVINRLSGEMKDVLPVILNKVLSEYKIK